MTVVINEMDVVAPEPSPVGAPDDERGGEQPSSAQVERRVEQALQERRARAQRLRAC